MTVNADNITIGPGASIDADYTGYRYGHGPGASTTDTSEYGPGGSYGGKGGIGSFLSAARPCYGSATNPVDLGSGGNLNSGSGAGGGATKLNVANVLTVNGAISARGQDHVGGRSAGGTGGSIWIVANEIAGTNGIAADGGNGGGSSGGGGGGGRIALFTRIDRFTEEMPGTHSNYAGSANGRIKVNGGTGYAAGTNGTFHLEVLLGRRTLFMMR